MTSRLASTARLCAAAAAVGVLVAGCVVSPSRVFVKGVLSPPESSNGRCTYEPQPTGPFLSAGVLDVAFASTYQAPLLVGNQMVPRADLTQGRVETSRVQLEGTVVRLTDVNGNVVTTFTNYATGAVDPASGTQPSFGVIIATLVDQATAASLRQQLAPRESRRFLANVAVFGRTTGAQGVETAEYQYPLSVCLGCLVTFPPDSVDPVRAQLENGRPNCAKAATAGTTTLCNYGQDSAIDCRTCQGNPICDPNYPDVQPAPTGDAGT